MFQSELLVVRRSGNKISPLFRGEDGVDVVEDVINVFTSSFGEKKSVLDEKFSEYEGSVSSDHRFLRGLYTLLERMITPEEHPNTVEDSHVIRQAVYSEANRLFGGTVISDEDHMRVLDSASQKLQIPLDDLTSSIWADEDEEQVVGEFTPPTPERLISQYNLSLLQTLLFRATVLEVSLKASTSQLRDIIKMIRFYGLMYYAKREGGFTSFTLNGPVSTLKLTKKYGTSLAKTIPYLVEAEDWVMRANILDQSYSKKPRILEFSLSRGDFSKYYFVESRRLEDGDRFDSLVEYEFFHEFDSLKTGWDITREPDPLVMGSTVMFPDFSFERAGFRVYMEVVGFWTEEYLKNKLEKLSRLPPGIKFILCIDRGLQCSPRSHKDMEVVYYRKHIPVKRIYGILQKYEEAATKMELHKIDDIKIAEHLTSPIITLNELSSKLRVSPDSIRKYLEANVVGGYSHTPSLLLSEHTLSKIKSRLDVIPADEVKYPDVAPILGEYGIPEESYPEVLHKLGYRLEWKSLNIEDSTVVKT